MRPVALVAPRSSPLQAELATGLGRNRNILWQGNSLNAKERRGPPPSRGLIDTPWLRSLAGKGLALYLRLVQATTRVEHVPADRNERLTRFAELRPAIMVSWHTNILALPFFLEPGMGEFVALASPHADGQIGAAAITAFGYRAIVGTGASHRQTEGTGGTGAFRAMLKELAEGRSVYLSGEVPPIPGRHVSMGIIALARASGRPIIAIAAAGTRRTVFERLWDKMEIYHPFGRAVVIADGPLFVDETISNEDARDRLKTLLDSALDEAQRRIALES
jgi:lysophospholipid acyltransferase (LPLAT)-like uncharacterized protein